jgi:hypothetical protein
MALQPRYSVKEPGTALLFLLRMALVLEGLELLLVESLCAALCFETATVVTVGGSINVEERIHLTLALVLVIVHLRPLTSLLELAGETIELRRGGVLLTRVVWSTGGGGSGSFLGLLLFLSCLFGIVCVWIIAAMNGWIVTTPLASRRRAGARCART